MNLLTYQAPWGERVDPERERLLLKAAAIQLDAGCDPVDALLRAERASAPYRVPEGFTVDAARLALLRAAWAHMDRHGSDLLAALEYVESTGPTRQPPAPRPTPTTPPIVGTVLAADAIGLSAPSATVQLQQPNGTSVAGFAGTAYSGGIIAFAGQGDVAIDLQMLTPPHKVPVLRNHDADAIVGHAVIVNDGNTLRIAEGRFSAVTAAGREVAGLLAEGQPWQLSVGVRGRWQRVDRSTATPINGRRLHIDAIMRAPRLLEVSFVPAGADQAARASR